MVASTKNPCPTKKTKTKVKTGCRTCKIRKVKCDEGRPACQRCISTGRVCDGYGIWGGGGNAYGERANTTRESCKMVIPHNPRSTIGAATPERQDYFRWFTDRTVIKFPGACPSAFWEMLVFQGSEVEPAILHAVVALSSAHKRESLEGYTPRMAEHTLDLQQQFTLQEYGKAIRHLQPHFSTRSRRSMQVALITCAIFGFLETFLGHYNAGTTHLQSGLKLLAQTQFHPKGMDDDASILRPPRGYVDDWIIDIFSRLHVAAALLGQCPPHLFAGLQVFPPEPLPGMFKSANHATQCLNRLIGEILYFGEQCSFESDTLAVGSLAGVMAEQRRLQGELSCWVRAYQASKTTSKFGVNHRDALAYKLLYFHFTMAKIMVDTSVCPTSESRFDGHTGDFLSLITQAIDIWHTAYSTPIWYIGTGSPPKICSAIGDKGWMPPLYYVAVKCRVHRLRLQALRLLSTTPNREGIWDGELVFSIAEEVVRIEEQGFYDGSDKDDKFPVDRIPERDELALLPLLPESNRLHDVRIRLPDHATGKVTLACRRNRGDDTWELLAREYDPISKRWANVLGNSSPPLDFPKMKYPFPGAY